MKGGPSRVFFCQLMYRERAGVSDLPWLVIVVLARAPRDTPVQQSPKHFMIEQTNLQRQAHARLVIHSYRRKA